MLVSPVISPVQGTLRLIALVVQRVGRLKPCVGGVVDEDCDRSKVCEARGGKGGGEGDRFRMTKRVQLWLSRPMTSFRVLLGSRGRVADRVVVESGTQFHVGT